MFSIFKTGPELNSTHLWWKMLLCRQPLSIHINMNFGLAAAGKSLCSRVEKNKTDGWGSELEKQLPASSHSLHFWNVLEVNM